MKTESILSEELRAVLESDEVRWVSQRRWDSTVTDDYAKKLLRRLVNCGLRLVDGHEFELLQADFVASRDLANRLRAQLDRFENPS